MPRKKWYPPGTFTSENHLRKELKQYVESQKLEFMGHDNLTPFFGRIEPTRGSRFGMPDTVIGTMKGLIHVELKCEEFQDFSRIVPTLPRLPVVNLRPSQVETLPEMAIWSPNVFVLTAELGGMKLALCNVVDLFVFKHQIYNVMNESNPVEKNALRNIVRNPFKVTNNFADFRDELGLRLPRIEKTENSKIADMMKGD